jgi:bifunctional DNA-binding transcriptional regulator/antitoxin component of YhaV-PrlF toxin-antitoxin module
MFSMALVAISTKYQMVIPRVFRKRMKLAPRQKLTVNLLGDDMLIVSKPIRSALDLAGTMDFPKEYLKNERLSWE